MGCIGDWRRGDHLGFAWSLGILALSLCRCALGDVVVGVMCTPSEVGFLALSVAGTWAPSELGTGRIQGVLLHVCHWCTRGVCCGSCGCIGFVDTGLTLGRLVGRRAVCPWKIDTRT